MAELTTAAPAFVEMAHRIVWATVATVDGRGRPRTRILHPIWEWDGERLTGWVATSQSPVKAAHLARTPYVSVNYWTPANHDTCSAECAAEWAMDDGTRTRIWNLFAGADAPVGYDPRIVPGWTSPTEPPFAALRLEPWRLRVFPARCCWARAGRSSRGAREPALNLPLRSADPCPRPKGGGRVPHSCLIAQSE